MTNDETEQTIYFMDTLVNYTIYSIDIITYPVPTFLPTDFTSDIVFPTEAKKTQIKIPSGINDIFGYEADFITDAGSEILTFNYTKAPNVSPDSSVLLICDKVKHEYSNFGVLYTITPSYPIGSLIVDRPAHPIYSELKMAHTINLLFVH